MGLIYDEDDKRLVTKRIACMTPPESAASYIRGLSSSRTRPSQMNSKVLTGSPIQRSKASGRTYPVG